MSYLIQSTKKTKSKSSDFETKALLYLMNFRDDSEEIYYFVVDFFNDLTGIDRYSKKTWDLQSKAVKNNYPSDIGKELVTLFKNYISEFEFDYFILFIGGVVDSIRKDNTKNVFDIKNINSKSIKKIEDALMKECRKKSYIDNNKLNQTIIKNFIEKVIFVIDIREKWEYVQSIIKVNPYIIPEKTVLNQIFNQIRDVQSSKKNNNNVEGIIINEKEDFIYYSRHLDKNEIKMMVLNRIVNNNIMQRGITPSFAPIYSKFSETDRNSIFEDCQHNIAKTLFDKNNSENFWNLFNNIYQVIISENTLSVDDIYKKVNRDILNKAFYLDIISLKYFIAIIKDGIYENK